MHLIVGSATGADIPLRSEKPVLHPQLPGQLPRRQYGWFLPACYGRGAILVNRPTIVIPQLFINRNFNPY